MLRFVMLITMLVLVEAAWAEDAAVDAAATNADDEQFKTLSGMSVLGNNEAPKSLVIVPWKSSQIGDGIGVVDSLSNRPMPVDRDVFSRELHYYELRTDPGIDGSGGEDLSVGRR
jgi:hypothetical protein